MPKSLLQRSGRISTTRFKFGMDPPITTLSSAFPPATSKSRSVARAEASKTASGSTPRSNRKLESEINPSRRLVRRMKPGLK